MKRDFDYIVDTATDCKGFTIKQTLRFHYFNPNGLYAEKKAINNKVAELVNAGKVNSGWHFVYGSFSDYAEERLVKLATQKTVPSWSQTRVVLEMLQEDIAKANKAIDELGEK